MINAESCYIPVRIKGTLLFKYDPLRHLVQIKVKREIHTIDLAEVELEAAQAPGPMGYSLFPAGVRRGRSG